MPNINPIVQYTTPSEASLIASSAKSNLNGDDLFNRLVSYFEGAFQSFGQSLLDQMTYNKEMMEAQHKFNADEAQKTRDWQEYMRNSAFQATVTDLRKAGLNPILAFGSGGATSTPQGAVATGSSAATNIAGGDTAASILSALVNSANQLSGTLSKLVGFLK